MYQKSYTQTGHWVFQGRNQREIFQLFSIFLKINWANFLKLGFFRLINLYTLNIENDDIEKKSKIKITPHYVYFMSMIQCDAIVTEGVEQIKHSWSIFHRLVTNSG